MRLIHTTDQHTAYPVLAKFMTLAYENEMKFLASDSWGTDEKSLDALDDYGVLKIEQNFEGNTKPNRLIEIDGVLVNIGISWGAANVILAANDKDLIQPVLDKIKELIPETGDRDDGTVPITFWAYDPRGPVSFRRRIIAPTWEEIQGNYTADVKEVLERMVNDFIPGKGGQLVLWEGIPGTGKTFALRALAQEWKAWAKFHYISDPEEFFGKSSYMFQVCLQDSDGESPIALLEDGTGEVEEPKWNVLILEDCGELLAADAKAQTGQAISRLLNMVDGLIGQGLRILVLVTTNEKVQTFHEAVTRPGRCAIKTHFDRLSVDEATEWLKNHNQSGTKHSATVAELFSIIDGTDKSMQFERTVGFAAKS